jgi:DNA-binding response OmpR family regulator
MRFESDCTSRDQQMGQYRILVIDDDLHVRRAIRGVLEDEGFRVETAADGHKGLAQGVQNRPDLIVLDLHLPLRSGDEVAARLREIYGQSLPIVLVTSDDRPEEKARRIGAESFLRKPFDLEALVTAVRTCLKRPAV